MLFNTYLFIFIFLPVMVAGYYVCNRFRLLIAGRVWLVIGSLFFYSWWSIAYLPLILASIVFNYTIGRLLQTKQKPSLRSALLICGITVNLLLLGYYKYTDFFLLNLNAIAGSGFPLLELALPLGISFFTFTQIAYLVDASKGKVKEYDIINYALFVTFFPHLIAGPILHHKEMMPQFDRLRNKLFQYSQASVGLYLFCIGLFKKVVIADTFATYANYGFDEASYLSFIQGWATSLSYTIQLYYDFSGYTDMAIGAALLFNIKLPANFNSPYKALSIQDFWRRWHMTLSRFLRDYIYIPLGGNRKGEPRMLLNLFITFVIGGLWHGAGWTFLLWGMLHGVALVVHRLWQKVGRPLPVWLAWLITFQFINITWVLFRAEHLADAQRIIQAMFGFHGFGLELSGFYPLTLLLIAIMLPITLLARNSMQLADRFIPSGRAMLATALLFVISLLYFNKISTFLYFNF